MTYKEKDFLSVLVGNLSTEKKIELLVSMLVDLDIDLRSHLNGARYITLGDTDDATAGNIRYHSGTFQGYDGTSWIDLS